MQDHPLLPKLLDSIRKVAAGPEKASEPTPPEQTAVIQAPTENLLVKQIANEYLAHYTYKGIAAWADAAGLEGFSAWCEASAAEELKHADKVIKYLTTAGFEFEMPSIPAVSAKWESAFTAAEAIMDHEKKVTSEWKAIGKTAIQEGDLATVAFAGAFLIEQMEEENKAATMLSRFLREPGINLIDFNI